MYVSRLLKSSIQLSRVFSKQGLQIKLSETFPRINYSQRNFRHAVKNIQNSRQNKSSEVRIILKCGIFTFASINGVFATSIIWSYENWRDKIERFKKFSFDDRKIFHGNILDNDIFWLIFTLNLIVFVLNRSNLKAASYFLNSPYGPTPALSQLLSIFSHHSYFHFLMNMYALYNFSNPLVQMLGKEQYLALFLSGGIFSSFLSNFSKVAFRTKIPSLGASGGICALIASFCILNPEARIGVPLIPYGFTCGSFLPYMVIFEIFGALFLVRISPMDHAAHLGGLLFGIFYVQGGWNSFWHRRHYLVKAWQKLRGDTKKDLSKVFPSSEIRTNNFFNCPFNSLI